MSGDGRGVLGALLVELLDGEAVIIHFARGTYYSTDGVGAVVWELLEGGRTLEEVTAAIARRYGVAEERARQDLADLLEELLDEDLITEAGVDQPRPTAQREDRDERGKYERPMLHVYRDMADLMVFLEPPTPGESQEALHFPGRAPGSCACDGNATHARATD